ncbi:hypothetical protein IGI04_029847 [Brassica rapa subsp. trilocularis]|uniref:Uncharacterized protein n=1 Tax=Brassica rapa subsp. trilocularis TaxID=1813537 RepID=A0ABQ7LP02_BRACM|nr:hypothetical protein IGI04_029847 [Brassica rapa subsp. trilocularis]
MRLVEGNVRHDLLSCWLELHRRIRYLSMDGDLSTSFELAFQCHQFEVNQHPAAEVMPVLLKSVPSASRQEAVKEMKGCRSMKHHWYRSTVIPENRPSLFRD